MHETQINFINFPKKVCHTKKVEHKKRKLTTTEPNSMKLGVMALRSCNMEHS